MKAGTIRVANAPCSWGVLEFEKDLVGQASSTMGSDRGSGASSQAHDTKPATYERVLDEIAQTGYAGTELGDWGFMPVDPDALQGALEKRSLSMLAAFVPIDFSNPSAHESGTEIAVKTARLISAVSKGETPFIVLADENGKNETRTRLAGRIQKEQELSEQSWRHFASGVELVAKQVLDATGVKTVFHHHCAGFIETTYEIDRLMELTDPSLVGLCLDTGHCTFGGGDPVAVFERYRERVHHVHFKDCSNPIAQRSRQEQWEYFTSIGRGVFCELGKGAVDFPRLLEKMKQALYSGWIVVEQDVLPGMGNPAQSAQRNRDYLASLGL